MDARRNVTADKLREILSYDPETGLFRWRISPSANVVVGANAGTLNRASNRHYITINNVMHRRSRLAWLYVHGEWPRFVIDHINSNPQDDRIANLRDVTSTLNAQNTQRPKKNNKYGFRGVERRRTGRYSAYIRIDGKKKYLGMFDTPSEAEQAYVSAKRSLHHGFVR